MYTSKVFIYILLTALTFASCKNKVNDVKLIIDQVVLLDSLPSASGMVIHNKQIAIITDDAPFIYLSPLEKSEFRKVGITGTDTLLYRITKALKPDYESACKIRYYDRDYLLSFGSGSTKSLRDTLLMVSLDDASEQQRRSLTDIYTIMQQVTSTKPDAWNIEGATTIGNFIFLANRGNNKIISVPVFYFSESHRFEHVVPKIDFFQVELPEINSHEARLSGLSTVDEKTALFCASVEDTPDWLADGPILGSFIGLIDIEKKKVISAYPLLDAAGKTMIEKIESVEFVSKNEQGKLNIIAVTDNDKGSSKLFYLTLPAAK